MLNSPKLAKATSYPEEPGYEVAAKEDHKILGVIFISLYVHVNSGSRRVYSNFKIHTIKLFTKITSSLSGEESLSFNTFLLSLRIGVSIN